MATGSTTRVLERDRELTRLEHVLAAARDGRGGAALVEGEGGIGKSSLLEATAASAREAGMEVLRAAGHELEHEIAFGVARQLFEARLARASDGERSALLAGSAALAEPLLSRHDAEGDPERAIHGLYWLAAGLAERAPLVLVVDDAHLADAASLRFLLYLAHRIDDLPLALCVGARPAEPGPGAELLPRLRAHPATAGLSPGPLSVDAVRWLVADLGFPGAEARFVEACAEASGGNPLYLRELLGVLAESAVEGTADAVDRVHAVGPRAVAEAVRLALGRLGPEATSLARAIAILGDEVAVRDAARLADLAMPVAVETAARLIDTGVLRSGERLTFRHPIVRASIYDELRPVETAWAHGFAAGLLAEGGGAPEVPAAHLLLADPVREPWAADVLARAGERALAAGDADAAQRFLGRALEEAPPLGRRASLGLVLGRAQLRAGDAGAAAETLTEARSHAGPSEAPAILRALGQALFFTGRLGEAAAAYASAADAFDDPDEAARARADGMFVALLDPSQRAEALARVEPLVAADREPSSPGERLLLAHVAGDAFLRGEDRERVLRTARGAWGDGELLRAVTPDDPALYGVSAALAVSDDYDTALALADAAIGAARERGSIGAFGMASYARAGAHRYVGNLTEAIADLERALEVGEGSWEVVRPGAVGLLAQCHLQRGSLREAAELVTVDDSAMYPSPPFAWLLEHRGWARLAERQPAEALEAFDRSGQMLQDALGAPNPALAPWRAGRALALFALGRRDEAVAAAEEEVELARRFGAPRALGAALRVLGVVSGDLATLDEAVAVLEPTPCRLESAHAHVDLGAARAAAGDVAGSQEALRAGLDLADACDARPLADRAREALVATGARPRRARTTGAAALTPSELRVARMAADGAANREIAEALFVTVKAVKWHLGNAYRKLGIASRGELADALAR